MDAPNSARARVRRGIAALNAHFGNSSWRKKIDLAKFDVAKLNECPLAQLFDRWYGKAPVELRMNNKALGFERGLGAIDGVSLTGVNIRLDYDALNRAWKSELRTR